MSQIHFCNDGTHTFTDKGTTPEGYASVCINNGGEKISTTPIAPPIKYNTLTFRVLEDITKPIGKCLEMEDFGSGYDAGIFQTFNGYSNIRGPMCLVREKRFLHLKAGDIIRTKGHSGNSAGELGSITIPYGNNGEAISLSMVGKDGYAQKLQLLKGNYLPNKQWKNITNNLQITMGEPEETIKDVKEFQAKKTITAGLGGGKIAMILIVGGFIYYAYSKGLLKK